GTPYLVVDGLPAGVDDTLQLLRKLRIRLPFADEELAAVQRLEEQRWAYYVEQIADVYYEHNLQKEVALVGETSLILGLAGFLSASFGLIPKVLVMTDPLPESAKAAVTAKIEQLIADYATEVAFEEDQGRINDIIRRNGVELLLASSLEQKIAAELNIPLLPIAFPVTNAVILQKSYIGFKGAITLLEDLSSRIVAWREEGKDADYA
ncbi:MAG TPA: oxalate:formate antiporter, partial [Firmicutes bacterium]|nr:oxalate:formate antiporter [Bacillota bacterium]